VRKRPRLECIEFSEFYNDAVNEHEELLKTEALQVLNKAKPVFGVCEMTFVLEPKNKSKLLQIESALFQRLEARATIFNQLFSVGSPVVNPFLVLRVRRSHLVEDALQQLAQHPASHFKRPLKVAFDGEEGVDEGGVQKEFFQLLLAEMYNPDFGMFVLDTDAQTFWFSKTSFEANLQFELFGTVLGLAIYNNIILDVHFPVVLYKKLLGDAAKSLEDLLEFSPSIAQNFATLLDMDEQTFNSSDMGLTFSAAYESFGAMVAAELKPGGESITVKYEDREEYVRLYTEWILHDSVKDQIHAFKRGFDKCFTDESRKQSGFLRSIRPEDLEVLICGQPELDFRAWREACQYTDGYDSSSKVCQWFWEIIDEDLEAADKRKLLQFITGSDRAPVGGLGELPLALSRHGPDSDRLPQAHTCFNHLLIPEYSSKEKFRAILRVAINNCEGFGLQ
jgi:hypothetical protein